MAETDLTPNGFTPNKFPFKDSEKDRMNILTKAKNHINLSVFWAIYEIDETLTGRTIGKIERFSLLHIGGEAWYI